MEPIEMTVFIDEDSNECLYVEGKRWEGAGETTIYIADIVAHAKDRPILLKHVDVPGDWYSEWPETLAEVTNRIATQKTATAS